MSRRPGRAGQRGFSLIELVVVVIIIAILAVVAVPAVTHQMRDRRVYQAAQEVVSVYRGARMQAMGRGAAVLVRYETTDNAAGSLVVQEAVRGVGQADPRCERLPTSSCVLPQWVTPAGTGVTQITDNILVSRFDPWRRSAYTDVKIGMKSDGATGSDVTYMDVCFTPLGRAYVRYAPGAAWQTLAGVPTAKIWRDDGKGGADGLIRTVMVMPNGAARFGVAQ